MANIESVNFDYIRKWEGGLSSHKADIASKNPVPSIPEKPNPKGIHTNVGVTWAAWVTIFGNTKDSVLKFYEMPKDMWLKVYRVYWNMVSANSINSDIIAEFLADFAWGSGGNAPRELQKLLIKLGYYEKEPQMRMNTLVVNALNKAIAEKGEAEMYRLLFEHRCNWLRKIPSFATFGKGWMNRLNDFNKYATAKIKGQ